MTLPSAGETQALLNVLLLWIGYVIYGGPNPN